MWPSTNRIQGGTRRRTCTAIAGRGLSSSAGLSSWRTHRPDNISWPALSGAILAPITGMCGSSGRMLWTQLKHLWKMLNGCIRFGRSSLRRSPKVGFRSCGRLVWITKCSLRKRWFFRGSARKGVLQMNGLRRIFLIDYHQLSESWILITFYT